MIKWSVPADHPRYIPLGYCGELHVDVDLQHKGLCWEMLKMEIRAFTVSYSKRKSFQSRQEEAELLKKLNVLQKKTWLQL